jgi:hypothetical protein
MIFKKLLAFSMAILTISSAFADYNNDNCCNPCPPDPCGCEIPAGPMQSAYSHPARVNVCGSCDAFASASFLYWQPRENGLNLGVDEIFTSPNSEIVRDLEMDFEYKAGFKILLGYNFEYDNWQTLIRYTRMNMDTSTSANNKSPFDLVPIWFSSTGGNTTEITNKWDLDFNIFDWELSRPYFSGKNLNVNLIFGLKSGWIDQSLLSLIINSGSPYKTIAKSDSWILGSRIGINSEYVLFDRFRILGDFAASLFYQKFSKIKITQDDLIFDDLIVMNFESSYQNINFATEFKIGLGWGTYFNSNNWYFDISAAYEMQLYFNQNQMRSSKDAISHYVSTSPGNLQLHGLTVTARFDF